MMDDSQIIAAYHKALESAAEAKAGLGVMDYEFDERVHPAVKAELEERVTALRAEAARGNSEAFDKLRAAMSLLEFIGQYEACRDRASDMARELASLRLKVERREGHVREPVPRGPWHGAGKHAELLEKFAECNPMYSRAGEDERYAWYEADVNARWLDSTSHEASRAPFSPTWLLSALAIAERAANLGYKELVDVGSGDGRVAFCAALRGMRALSVEIDPGLAELQQLISDGTGVKIEIRCADAASWDCPADLKRPVFAVGGLAQMGAAELAEAVLRPGAGFVLAGTRASKYGGKEPAGWGKFLESAGQSAQCEMNLPTAWTAGEPEGTPYVFAGPRGIKKAAPGTTPC